MNSTIIGQNLLYAGSVVGKWSGGVRHLVVPALQAIRSRMITRTGWFVMKQAVHFHVEQTGYERLVNLLHVPVAWLCRTPLRIICEVRRFAGPPAGSSDAISPQRRPRSSSGATGSSSASSFPSPDPYQARWTS